jgi:hypothetical protein
VDCGLQVIVLLCIWCFQPVASDSLPCPGPLVPVRSIKCVLTLHSWKGSVSGVRRQKSTQDRAHSTSGSLRFLRLRISRPSHSGSWYTQLDLDFMAR